MALFTIKIDKDEPKASMTVSGEFPGVLLAYLFKGLEPYFTHAELKDFVYDLLDGLPDNHVLKDSRFLDEISTIWVRCP